jgi:hypothetical protein
MTIVKKYTYVKSSVTNSKVYDYNRQSSKLLCCKRSIYNKGLDIVNPIRSSLLSGLVN